MNANVISVLTLDEFMAALRHPSALIEVSVVLGCMALAWLASALLQRQSERDGQPSIWFGRRIVDGALFPALSLVLALLAKRLVLKAGLPLALFKIAIPVLVSFAVIRLSVRVLTVAFPTSPLVRATERTISWLAWLAMVGWVTGVLPEFLDELDQIHWSLGTTTVSVRKLLDGLLSASLMLMLVLWVSAAIETQLLKGAVGEQLSLRKAAANAVRALLTFIGLLLALSSVGIDLTALSVLGGAIGVGLGFGLQKLAANYVSGFVILAERSVRIGDMVRIGGFEGRISDITTRYTVVRSIAGSEAIIPNETLMTSTVENLSLADPRVLLTTQVSVAYGTEVVALQAKIADSVLKVPRVLAEPVPSAQLASFGPDGLDLTVVFWINDPENGSLGVRSAVNLALLALFEAESVEIPYPQRVVRLANQASVPTATAS